MPMCYSAINSPAKYCIIYFHFFINNLLFSYCANYDDAMINLLSLILQFMLML